MKHNVSPRFLRLKHIIGDYKVTPPIPAIIPISKTTWWDGVKKGKYPKPFKIGSNTTVWRSDEIQKLVDNLCNDNNILIYLYSLFHNENKFEKVFEKIGV